MSGSAREPETLPGNSTDSQTVKNKIAQNNLLGRHKVQGGASIRYRALRIFRKRGGYMVQLNFFSNFLDGIFKT